MTMMMAKTKTVKMKMGDQSRVALSWLVTLCARFWRKEVLF